MKKREKNSKKIKKKEIKEIKKKKKIIEEESELEKNIENTEEKIEGSEFREFLQPIDIEQRSRVSPHNQEQVSLRTPAPILKKIETLPQESLELELASEPASARGNETAIDYTPRNEPKYSNITTENNLDKRKYESEFRPPILRPTDSSRFREEFLMPSREIGIKMDENEEKIETNALEQKRREAFEKDEKKYRKVRL